LFVSAPAISGSLALSVSAAAAAGDLVGWYEARPSDRPDVYLDDDGAFLAEELFCVPTLVELASAARGLIVVSSIASRAASSIWPRSWSATSRAGSGRSAV
jgi:hypothetical protein